MGGNDGGFVFYLKGNKLTYGYNYVADQRFRVESKELEIAAGDHIFSFEFTPTGKAEPLKGKGTPATIKLLLDGMAVGEGKLPVTIPLTMGLSAGVAIGSDNGSPVMEASDYAPPFAYSGPIRKALVDISGEVTEDLEAKARMYLARQ
jgi:arylsulfatase